MNEFNETARKIREMQAETRKNLDRTGRIIKFTVILLTVEAIALLILVIRILSAGGAQ